MTVTARRAAHLSALHFASDRPLSARIFGRAPGAKVKVSEGDTPSARRYAWGRVVNIFFRHPTDLAEMRAAKLAMVWGLWLVTVPESAQTPSYSAFYKSFDFLTRNGVPTGVVVGSMSLACGFFALLALLSPRLCDPQKTRTRLWASLVLCALWLTVATGLRIAEWRLSGVALFGSFAGGQAFLALRLFLQWCGRNDPPHTPDA